MNDAIFKFKRYEDSSLSYTGIDKHEGKDIGGWDTVIKREEYERLFYNQQSTMEKSGVVDNQEFAEEREQVKMQEAAKPAEPTTPIASKPTFVTEAYGIKKPNTPITPAATSAEQKTEPELDLSGVEVGTSVTHKTFGTGTVTKIDQVKKHIRVTFSAGEKIFIFPDAFVQGFLEL